MIERYTRPKIGAIWTDEARFRTWLQVELAVCKSWAKRGRIPEEALNTILDKADFDTEEILTIEKTVRHDVIAFLTSVARHVGADSRYIHLGMTSSDMLDTALALQLKQVAPLLLDGCERLKNALKEKALKYRRLPAIGRTHGVHAEPVAFGLRFARFYEQMDRASKQLEQAFDSACVGKLSGAVGCYVHLDPEMEEEVMDRLGIGVAPISSQIVSRDRIASLLAAIALVGAVMEGIALEVRHLQRTEVGEAREGFRVGQKGSSAMPHKRNPIDSEKICGMARLLRGNMHAAYENVALWHERDISHSSVERVILPDSTIALSYLLHLTSDVVENLYVEEANIERNLGITGGAVFSEGLLLELVQTGMTRENAYAIVQRVAHGAMEKKVGFEEAALDTPELKEKLDEATIRSAFDLNHILRNVDFIYRRLGLDE